MVVEISVLTSLENKYKKTKAFWLSAVIEEEPIFIHQSHNKSRNEDHKRNNKHFICIHHTPPTQPPVFIAEYAK